MPEISLCMIAKNEEEWIGKAIDSCKGLVSEVIVVDTGSEDKTKEIAMKKGAKVFDFKWVDDFSAARNESLKHATKEWILVLDADETISDTDLQRIRKIIETDECDAFTLVQRNYVNDEKAANFIPNPGDYNPAKHCKGYFPQSVVRLFRNNKKYRYQNAVHELVEYSINSVGGIISDSGVVIHHFGYLKEGGIVDRKRKFYLEIGKKQLKEDPNNVRAIFDIGLIYKNRGELDKAAYMFEKAARIDETYHNPYLALGEVYSQKKDYKKAEDYYKKAVLNNPKLVSAYVNLGDAYFNLRMYDKAEEALTKGLSLNEKSVMCYQNLFAVFIKKEEYGKALSLMEQAVEKTGMDLFKVNYENLKRFIQSKILL